MRTTASALALTLGLGACTDDPAPPAEARWEPLATAAWTLAPGQEQTSDLSISTVAEATAIAAIRPLAPVGTHHTLLARGDAGLTSTTIVYASGVGASELVFPPGTAMTLAAGELLGLQLHIYNNSDQPLTGRSGIEVRKLDPALVEHEVGLFLPGPRDFAIAPGVATASGTCTVTSAQTVFAVFPHMHRYGTHLKTTITTGGTPHVLYDGAYSFEHRQIVPFTPIQLAPGDTIQTECTWNNTTAATIGYGESPDTELCFSILFRYPDDGQEFCD